MACEKDPRDISQVSFASLHAMLRSKAGKPLYTKSLLSFDPGQTTGWAYFEGDALVKQGQAKTKDLEEGIVNLTKMIDTLDPQEIVLEDYRIYSWKAKEHSFSELHTPKLIGSIYAIAHARGIPVTKQPAHLAKRFCTDKKLQLWKLYAPGQRHARDAVRHACFYILFGATQENHKPSNSASNKSTVG